MDVNNLTNVYNQNPTLQGSYTLQQYLDLFGGSSTTPPPSTIEPTDPNAPTTPLNPGQGIINANINQFQRDSDGSNIKSFRKDPRVGGALEAYDRNKQLTSMGINDPFANEISLQGAYYDDMPNFDDSVGGQTMMGKVKQGIGRAMQYTPGRIIGNIASKGLNALGQLLPVNERAIRENIMGNVGVRVDDIGRIVNTGNYNDPENVMAGYNQNKLTDESFNKRTDRIEQTLKDKYDMTQTEIDDVYAGTYKGSINTDLFKRMRSLKIGKDRNKFGMDVAAKEATRRRKEKEAKKQKEQEQAFQDTLNRQQQEQRQADLNRIDRAYREDTGGNAGSYAPGGGSGSHAADASGSTYSDPFDPGGGEKDGGYIDGSNRRKDFKNGGATNGSSKAALSAKVKELMDDGYEFGEAVKEAMKQGYMNGGRIKSYFKGGLVSLRGR